MAPTTYPCRYCGRKDVSRSIGGLKSHISQTLLCRQKRDEEHQRLSSLKRKRVPSVEANEVPPDPFDNTDNTAADSKTDGDPHRKRVHTEHPSCFRPTGVVAIVDYPEEAAAGAIIKDAEGGYETRFQKISREQ